MKKRAIFTAVFFNYIGYYVCLMLLFYAGSVALSQFMSIPLRMVILGCLFYSFVKNDKLKPGFSSYVFLFFSAVYLSRILVDVMGDKAYYVSAPNLTLYFISFDVIPFLLITNTRFSKIEFDEMRKGLLFSGFLFSILAIFFLKII